MNLAFRADLSPADLAILLDGAGTAAPFNLRPDVPPEAGGGRHGDENTRTRLAAAGLMTGGDAEPGQLSAAGRAIANVLLSPRHVIEMSVWTAAQRGSLTVAFPASPAAGAGVIVNRQNGKFQLGGFIDDTAVGDLVAPVLAILPADVPATFEAALTLDQSAVLAAVLDSAAVQDRPDRAFSARHVTEWLEIWWGSAGSERLCGQIFSLALRADPPAAETVARVLGEFAGAGLVQAAENGRHRLAPPLTQLAAILAGVESGLDWQRVSAGTEGGAPAGRIVHFLMSSKGGVSLELAGADRLVVKTIGRAGAAAFLASELAARMPEVETEPAAAEPEIEAGAAHQARFCTRCGHPLDPSWKFCGACGASLEKE